MNNRVDLHFWEASSKRCLFFLSQQEDGSFDALRVAGLRHGGVGDEVDVGSLRAGSAFVGAVPAVGESVECAEVQSPAIEDADFGGNDVVAEDAETVVDVFARREGIGYPDGGAVDCIGMHCGQHYEV